MTIDETERDLLALPAFLKNPFMAPVANTINGGADEILKYYRIIRFNGRFMIEVNEPYPHFVTLDKEHFERIAYPLLHGSSRRYINEVYACLRATAEDLSHNAHFVLFGNLSDKTIRPVIWDMDALKARTDILPKDCVWRSPYALVSVPIVGKHKRVEFIMELAGGEEELYDDILQSLAPLLMNIKPDGTIWWIGNELGRGMLIDVLHNIFPHQLTAITPRRLTGGRLNYLLNNVIGNVVAEECDLRFDDLGTCKLIAEHKDYFRHKFHSQAGLTINGNIHHIFSGSNLASIDVRRWGQSSKVHAILFTQLPGHQLQGLDDTIYGQLIAEMCYYATQLEQQNHLYEWSPVHHDYN